MTPRNGEGAREDALKADQTTSSKSHVISVTRRDPLRITIFVSIENTKPRVRFNSSNPADSARMWAWLEAQPELARIVELALKLRDAA